MTTKEFIDKPIVARAIEWAVIILVSIGTIYAVASQTVADVREIKPLVRRHETQIEVMSAQYSSIKEQMNRIENKLDRARR